jgi:hypothetical protein
MINVAILFSLQRMIIEKTSIMRDAINEEFRWFIYERQLANVYLKVKMISSVESNIHSSSVSR